MKTFRKKTAVITGAANGIGRALAKVFSEMEMNLALIDLDEENLISIQKELSKSDNEVSIHVCDISDWKEVEYCGKKLIEIHPSIDMLVNSAAVSIHSPFEKLDVDSIKWINKINYLGTVYITKVFLPFLLRSEDAHIVNISSGAGIQGFANRTMYCASKFAVRGFSEALRMELFSSNVNVSCVFPGGVKTDMYTRSRYADYSYQTVEKEFLEKKGQDPTELSHQIIKGIKKNRPEIYPSKDVKLLKRLKGLFPSIIGNYIYKNQDKLPV